MLCEDIQSLIMNLKSFLYCNLFSYRFSKLFEIIIDDVTLYTVIIWPTENDDEPK